MDHSKGHRDLKFRCDHGRERPKSMKKMTGRGVKARQPSVQSAGQTISTNGLAIKNRDRNMGGEKESKSKFKVDPERHK